MADFLLELLSEEIPARMQEKASADLARMLGDELAKAGVVAEKINSYVTPRRLALIAHGLPVQTAASSEEIKGPKASAPPQALEGFLRKTGLTREQLVERDGVLFAVIEKPGRSTADLLSQAVPAIVRAFPWPKSMRWGTASSSTSSLRWVRPLQGIVALLGEAIVPIEVDGIVSGAATVGHRFHHPGQITIGSAADYVEKLRACHVIVDPAERRDIIRTRAAELAAAAGLVVVEDEGLVAENAGLTEWPVPLLGHFDPAFLEVPREVIQLTLRTNQKYFVLNDDMGRLAPAFICTANISAKDGGEGIVAGNGKVLTARLSDAKFFWEQDLKAPLEAYLPKLESMLFYEGMGTLREKADRISSLAGWIAAVYFPDREPETARRAGLLAKADLATGMVGEFPELQGIMGAYYAERGGEKPGAISALRQQYVAAVEGCIPACVALADRIDTLVAFFARGIKPTGSKDPFALRRAALQIIQTILVNGTRASLGAMIEQAKLGLGGATLDTAELLDFFADRLKVQQREAGIRHDLIDAVFALGGEDDLVRLLARVEALQAFVATEDGVNLLAGYKRAANILKKEGGVPAGATATPDYAPEPAEQALIDALEAAEPRAAAAVEAEDFGAAMSALASLRGPIDAFFEAVIVNDPIEAKRNTRLALLEKIRAAVHNVADFSKIEA
ncbi:MAG: glycine--tRNA ligase subunit beta [Pseudomonadota bacterium]